MSDPKEYIERGLYCETICRCNGTACDKSKCPIWNAPVADVATVVHGERKFDGLDFDGVDEVLKKHRAFVMATINGHGCHIGTYKEISSEADGDWIIDVDVESLDVTGQCDVAHVVRCKDCKHFIPRQILLKDGTSRAYTEDEKRLSFGVMGDVGINCGSRCMRCPFWRGNSIPVFVDENDFCSYGERKEE